MAKLDTDRSADVVMPVQDLNGRLVYTEAGDKLGTVRDVHTNEDGRIVALHVRDRWFLGHQSDVPASGMRFEGGDVIVPSSATVKQHDRHSSSDDVDSSRSSVSGGARTGRGPVLLSGHEGARSRFGGLDLLGSFFGALVSLASIVLISGILAAIFGLTDGISFDTSLSSMDDLLTESLLIGAATLFISCFIGGWAAGRSSRFDGAGNGMAMVAWLLGLGVLFGVLGWAVGDEYNVFANADIPSFDTNELAMWGVIGLLGAIALMLLGGVLGGLMGTRWHRRVDRAMMDVVPVGGSMASRGDSPDLDMDDDDDDDEMRTTTLAPDSSPRIRSLDEPLDHDLDSTRKTDRREGSDDSLR